MLATHPLHADLWAEYTVDNRGTNLLMFMFSLTNASSTAINPKIDQAKLIVNGKELKHSLLMFKGGLRNRRWKVLQPRERIRFGRDLISYFKPGTYAVYWLGEDFRSPEMVLDISSDGARMSVSATKIPPTAEPLQASLGVMYSFDDEGTRHLRFTFCLTNTSSAASNPKIGESEIIVNRKQLKDSQLIFSGAAGEPSRASLAPGEHIAFSRDLTPHLERPGNYAIYWLGENFRSPEIRLNVSPWDRRLPTSAEKK